MPFEALHREAGVHAARSQARLLLGLAKLIVDETRLARTDVWHLSLKGELLATVDWRGRKVAIQGALDANELREKALRWSHRPEGAAHAIPNFDAHGLDKTLWMLSQSSPELRLPDTMRQGELHLMRLPDIEIKWFKDRQLSMIERLLNAPMSLDDIRQAYPIGTQHIEADLVGLWWCGALRRAA